MDALGIDTLLSSARARSASDIRTSAHTQATDAAQAARQQAEEFESIFLNTMFQTMFAGLEDSAGTWGGGTGSDAWRGMLLEEYSNTIAKAGGIGIADSVERELLALQETSVR